MFNGPSICCQQCVSCIPESTLQALCAYALCVGSWTQESQSVTGMVRPGSGKQFVLMRYSRAAAGNLLLAEQGEVAIVAAGAPAHAPAASRGVGASIASCHILP